jgi:quinone-modifying oxidoreductase subunit QmoC
MSEAIMLDPDVGFIKEVRALGGGDLKKVLPVRHLFRGLSHFPREQAVSPQRNDCGVLGAQRQIGQQRRHLALPQLRRLQSTRCPRDAKPGDALGAIRAYAVSNTPAPRRWANWCVTSPNCRSCWLFQRYFSGCRPALQHGGSQLAEFFTGRRA